VGEIGGAKSTIRAEKQNMGVKQKRVGRLVVQKGLRAEKWNMAVK